MRPPKKQIPISNVALLDRDFQRFTGVTNIFAATNLFPGGPALESRVGINNTNPTDQLTVEFARCDGLNWINSSDRNLKENFEPVDGREVLEAVSRLPIQRWNYKSKPGTAHLGPVAQDFHDTFRVGSDDN